jgi:hypothetical protein
MKREIDKITNMIHHEGLSTYLFFKEYDPTKLIQSN